MVALVGGNRGGTAIVENTAAEVFGREKMLIIDPKPGRSDTLARRVLDRNPGAQVEPILMAGESASGIIARSQAIVCATDTLSSQAALLRDANTRQHVMWQIVGTTGPCMAPIFALRGTSLAGDSDRGSHSSLLAALQNLGNGGKTSRAITTDPLAGMLIGPQRRRISVATAGHLNQLNHDPRDLDNGGPIAISFGGVLLSLFVIPKFADRADYREKKEAALEIINKRVPALAGGAAIKSVAVVLSPRQIDFITVERNTRGALHVDGLKELKNPADLESRAARAESLFRPAPKPAEINFTD